ncbi:MAG: hypothetical protein K6G65_08910, partial [Lachnospiraceae bacterium]|nr:hypothetical protein [Lachnospiraceae bacterium]
MKKNNVLNKIIVFTVALALFVTTAWTGNVSLVNAATTDRVQKALDEIIAATKDQVQNCTYDDTASIMNSLDEDENPIDADYHTLRHERGHDSVVTLSNGKKVESSKVTIPNCDNIKGDITLPTTDSTGRVTYTWSSSNEAIISTKPVANKDYYEKPAGIVTRPAKDTVVNLTVRATYKSGSTVDTGSKTIPVTVKAKPTTNYKDEYAGYLYVHFSEYAGTKGQQKVYFGISKDGVNWTALNNNEAILTPQFNLSKKVTKNASVNYNTDNGETFYVGDGGLRDPYIIRSPEGDKFYMIGTDQNIYIPIKANRDWALNSSTNIVAFESDDLVHWSKARLMNVAGSIGEAEGYRAGNAWAPEMFYDDATGEYVITYASKVYPIGSNNAGKQYTFCSRTRDFVNFSEPEIFNDITTSNIDTSMFKEGDTYYKLVKYEDLMHVKLLAKRGYAMNYVSDEDKENGVNTMRVADRINFKNLGIGYETITNNVAGTLSSYVSNYEGSTMFKFFDRDEWCVMVDEYGGRARGYIPFITADLDEENSIYALNDGTSLMQDGCKHGGIIPITQKEYDALVEAYGVTPSNAITKQESQKAFASYTFEKDTAKQVTDASGNKFHASYDGIATDDDDAEKGKVMHILGDGGAITLPNGLLDGLDNMTLSFDAKMEERTNSLGDVSIGLSKDRLLYIKLNENNVTAGITSHGLTGAGCNHKTVKVDTNGSIKDKWVHIDLVMKDHQMALYVDKDLRGYNATVRSISELGKNLKTSFGKSFDGESDSFVGMLDNVAIYNRALSEQELGVAALDSVEYPASSAILDEASINNGKINFNQQGKSGATFTVAAKKRGAYKVGIGYTTNSNNAVVEVYTNSGISRRKEVACAKSSTEATAETTVFLNEGINTITLHGTSTSPSITKLAVDLNTVYPVTIGEETTYYDSLSKAFAFANANGTKANKAIYEFQGTETIDENITIGENTQVEIAKGIVINTADNAKITNNGRIYNNGRLVANIDGTGTISGNKAYYDMSKVKWPSTNSFVYDGKAKTVALTGLPSGVTVTYSNNQNTGVGNYVAKATFTYDTKKYNEPTVPEFSWTIAKGKASIKVAAATLSKKVGDKAFNLGVTANAKVAYNSSNQAVATVNASGVVTIKGAGSTV